VKAFLKRGLPASLVARYTRWRRRRDRARNAIRSSRDVFSEVYRRRQWGAGSEAFFSGAGSLASQAVPYAEAVREFAHRHRIKSIVDLGCGDFQVGQMLRAPGIRYVGVDIVPALIERNRVLFSDPDTQFLCLDFLTDALPAAELCLVRQVFQHLSNAEIAAGLSRLGQFPYVLVTEHYPAPHLLVAHNLDKPHGPDTRIVDGSGVFFDKTPFSITVEDVILDSPVEAPLIHPGETLRTLLLAAAPRGSEPANLHARSLPK
jgi:SAM-dependent methyltransferase